MKPENRQGQEESVPCDLDHSSQFNYVAERIRAKLDDYEEYDFSRWQVRALNIFFDLCQEFHTRDLFYATCLSIPRIMFGLETALYILEDEETFSLAGCSQDLDVELPVTTTWKDGESDVIVEDGPLLHLPVRCNPRYHDMLPFVPPENVIARMVVHVGRGIPEHMRLFMQKYANRVGYQLHHRIIRARNKEHLKFIHNLVEDIGHNVIVPNIYFKLYFNQLNQEMGKLADFVQQIEENPRTPLCKEHASKLGDIRTRMQSKFDEIFRHYEQTSLFLETLLRRRHFEEGHYVLEKRDCILRTEIVEPQLERYRGELEDRDIAVDFSLGGAPDQCIRLYIDKGLVSQVYANLFSNAVKYTGEATLPDGRSGKFLSYGWKIEKDRFGEDQHGIRLHVFTSGQPLHLDRSLDVYESGFRADNVSNEQGTGHGLFFVKQVVELHRGVVGFKALNYGNEFHFTLPLKS